MSQSDVVVRFLLEQCAVRGVWVQMSQAVADIFALKAYGDLGRRLLGESLAAAVMLSRGIKVQGRLAVQARGDGALRLLVAESTQDARVRAMADIDADAVSGLQQLVGRGYLAVVFLPETGEGHQGLVPLQADRLQDCLADYFRQSEQLPTALWLACDGERAAGLMLQALPNAQPVEEDWQRLQWLASTVKDEELLFLPCEALLRRLFHEETVTVFKPDPVRFQCTCSDERSRAALAVLGRDELQKLFAEQGEVVMDCQFCGRQYRYRCDDMQNILGEPSRELH